MKKLLTNKNLVIVILLILLGLGVSYHFNQTSKKDKKFEMELKLREALQDSVRTHKNKEGNWVSEKRTLQGDVNDLLKDNVKLNGDQRALLNTIRKINKDHTSDKEVWAAASIRYNKLIDSLNTYVASASNIDTTNSIISFSQLDPVADFQYNIDITSVRPYPTNKLPEIRFNGLDFPNKQTITFNFDKTKRKDFPVSFSVENTNKYFRVQNIESYVIPNIDKDIVDPSGWQKVGRWFKINGKYILVAGAGFGVGSVVN